MNKELVLNKESKKGNLVKKILTRGAFIIGYVIWIGYNNLDKKDKDML